MGIAKMNIVIDGVPLPADVSPLTANPNDFPFAGTWIGQWDGMLKTILVVESINHEGKVKVVYAIADNPIAGIKATWFRYDAEIVDRVLTMFGKGFTASFELSQTGRLKATFGAGYSFGILKRHSIDELTQANINIIWNSGTSQLLHTDLMEDGKAVSLEAVIFKPAGEGPFPLAVVNHGSTGIGNNPSAYSETWTNPWFAEILNEQGWLVAFPQRRGRGKSQGLYDEGFGADRSKGYTCEAGLSLTGADRALKDIQAAVDTLRRRTDVNNDPILIAGNSRGGILSIAYAGLYPNQTKAAINFVGGWISDNCNTADQINKTLFEKGSSFPHETLWLYGKNDNFYSMHHSRQNFTAFQKSGGKGRFLEATVAGDNNGHWLMSIPPLWQTHVLNYLSEDVD